MVKPDGEQRQGTGSRPCESSLRVVAMVVDRSTGTSRSNRSPSATHAQRAGPLGRSSLSTCDQARRGGGHRDAKHQHETQAAMPATALSASPAPAAPASTATTAGPASPAML